MPGWGWKWPDAEEPVVHGWMQVLRQHHAEILEQAHVILHISICFEMLVLKVSISMCQLY